MRTNASMAAGTQFRSFGLIAWRDSLTWLVCRKSSPHPKYDRPPFKAKRAATKHGQEQSKPACDVGVSAHVTFSKRNVGFAPRSASCTNLTTTTPATPAASYCTMGRVLASALPARASGSRGKRACGFGRSGGNACSRCGGMPGPCPTHLPAGARRASSSRVP